MASDWTPRNARAKSMRKLKSLRKRVQDVAEDIAYEFGDFDNTVVLSADDLRDNALQCIENLEAALIEACEAAEVEDD
jgi:hypothetical protein